MGYVLNEGFLPEKYFEDICMVPHGSFHEKPLSDYLVRFADKLGLRRKQDAMGNVIIYKNASTGYELHPTVLLQGHMDMVCDKKSDCLHDFEKDPLDLYIEDGKVHARGTTLGADDGVGVAYMMAVLSDPNVAHPPLECLFTVQEEVGCKGAAAVDGSDITAKRMIGLDNVTGDSTYICSAGMGILTIAHPLHRAVSSGKAAYMLKVEGLTGGHSGDEIHQEKGNSVKIAARTLMALRRDGFSIQLASVNGGSKINSIPRTCQVLFLTDANLEGMLAKVDRMQTILRREMKDSEPDLKLVLTSAEIVPASSQEESDEILECLYLFPNGLRHRSLSIEGLTTASSNLGVIETKEDALVLSCSARGAEDSFFEEIIEEIRVLTARYGWSEISYDRSSCWPYLDHSEVRDLARDAYREVTGRELILLAIHGGLECGDLSAACPGIDIVTLGPLVKGYHTYDEYLDLTSFAESYRVLLKLLEKL
ncbi:MAG: beta-Ala-His dipeptidase [Clostridiales bacterium]|nr:beta-Ala-His dipeptidase [Clostridiales bacterium]